MSASLYKPNSTGGVVYYSAAASQPPATQYPGGSTFTAVQENTTSVDDNNYGPPTSAVGAYFIMKFDVVEAVGTISNIAATMKFKGDGPSWGDTVALFIWNSNTSAYEQLASKASPSASTKYTLTGSKSSNISYYVDGTDGTGTICAQVQGGGSKMSYYISYAELDVTYSATAPEIAMSGNGQNIANGDMTPSVSDDTDFGGANVGETTVSHTFTITNSGDATLTLDGTPKVALSGTHVADFTVTAQPSSPVAISGGTTTFTIEFDPSATGVRSATVSIDNNDADEDPFTFAIQGTGTAPEIALSGNSQNIPNGSSSPSVNDDTYFGSTQINSGTVDHVFTVANSGTGPLTLDGTPKVALSGTHAADFSVTAQPSSPVASGGGSTTFTVRFAPTATGQRDASVSIDNTDADENPFTFDIQGTGIDAEIDVRGNGISIVDGTGTTNTADGTDFGDVTV